MKSKKLLLAAAGLLSVGALVACGGGDTGDSTLVDQDYNLREAGELKEGFTSLANTNANEPVANDGHFVAGGKTFWAKDTYKTTYSTEPTDAFFNYLINTWTYNSYHYCNMVDGLVENDKYGNIVGAIAIGYKVTTNGDGTETWTFQLRKNAEWVDNKTGKFYGKVTAHDFVSGAKYVLDPAHGSGTVAQITSFVKGAQEWNVAMGEWEKKKEGEAPSFDTVGVKAIDDYTLAYTLIASTPYFDSVLTYSPYLPVNQAYLDSKGTDFGKTCNDILVNGAFRITTHSYQVNMVYSKNFHYFDREHVYVNHVNRKFVPGTATMDTTRTWFEAGTIDSFTVNHDDDDGWSKYVKGPDGSGTLKDPYHNLCNAIQSYGDATYIGYFNYNRTYFASNASVSGDTTAAQRKAARVALNNVSFRQGFLYGLKVTEYLKRFSADEPCNYLMRGYTNKELNSASGGDYTDYVNKEYNSHQSESEKITSLIGIDNVDSEGKSKGDPVYNETKAKAKFLDAYNELIADGEITATDFPIQIDYLGSMNAKLQVYEQSMLSALTNNAKVSVGGTEKQVINIRYLIPASDDENTQWGSVHSNFDFSLWSGWGPDYADPNTYLHTMAIYGDMVDYQGFPTSSTQLATWELSEYAPKKYQDIKTAQGSAKAVEAYQEDVLGTYNAKYEIGAAITDPTKRDDRYKAFAEAEYELIFGSALCIPWYSQNGYYASVSNTVPWQAGRATYGLTSDKFKNVIVSSETIDKATRKAVTDEYNAGK